MTEMKRRKGVSFARTGSLTWPKRVRVAPAVGALLAALITAGSLLGQSFYGNIHGLLHDPNGLVVPNTKVVLIDELTNLTRTTTSNDDGLYVFNQVVPSTYTVAAEVAGFNRFERKGMIISTQEQVTLDIDLTVGKVTQTVEVTGAAPLIETANASHGNVLNEQQLAELPNIGRDAFIMARISNNMVTAGNPTYVAGSAYSTVGLVTVSGSMLWSNLFVLDGIPITTWYGTPIVIPSEEAVAEMKLQTNTYDADMGRTGGGVFNTIMKSGTNTFHGSAYGSIRRNSMDANLFFNNAAGLKLTPLPNDTWAGSLGGPIYIPHLYDGRNRTFFFLGYEAYNDTQAYSTQWYVPTAAEKMGDFTHSMASNGSPLVIYDPSTTVQNPDGSYTRTSFASEYGSMVIPTSKINTVGSNIAAYYPSPTRTPAYYGQPDITASTSATTPMRQYLGKIDEQFTPMWRATLSSLLNWSNTAGPNYFGGIASPEQWVYLRHTDGTAINNVITLSPTTVLAARYGFNRFSSIYHIRSTSFDVGSLGFAPSLVSQIAGLGFPVIAGNTMVAGDSLSGGLGALQDYTNNAASAVLSSTHGRHSLKAGFDFRRIETQQYAQNQSANFSFNGVFTQSTPTTHVAGTGADIADLLLGYPVSGSVLRGTTLADYTHYYAFYVQDDFRVSNRLTLNLGIRWDRENGPRESENRLITNFDETAVNPLAANVTGIVPHGILEFAGAGNAPLYAGNPNLNKLGPRIGAAYQINSKTVLRAGFGELWTPFTSISGPIAPPSFAATTPYIASNDGNATPANSLTNPFPNGLIQPVGFAAGTLEGIGQNVSIIDPNLKAGKILQYSADIQRQLPGGVAFSIGYLGTRGSNLALPMTDLNINENVLDPALFSKGATALNQQVANPFYGNGGVGVIGGPTVPAFQLLLPYPTYGQVVFQTSYNRSHYDSLVVKGEKRFSHGLMFVSTLTWARSYDLGSNGNVTMGGAPSVQNPFNIQAEYAPSNWQPPLTWGLGFSYQLPAGKGKWLLSKGGPLDYVVGGWQLNGISVYHSGFNIGINQSANNNGGFGYAGQRPNATGTSPETSGSVEQRLSDYINPAAFSAAPEFTFGNLARYIPMRGPGLADWELSLFKTVPIKERVKAQFRVEALNAFNTPQFYGPNTSFGSGSFGHITTQGNLSRQMELALRFTW
jgi:hypothetical protein